MPKYLAWVEADGGIGFYHDGDEESAKEYLEEVLDTGDLGPPKVKNVELDE